MQMAEAYSAFPAMGTKVRPFPIVRVEDAAGRVLWEPQPERTQVLDSLVAAVMVTMLEDVVVRGTGYNAIRLVAGLPREVRAAGKTGTTNDGTDVWFVGFTPDLLAAVWFGMDRPQPIFRLNRGRQATGGGLAGPVWGRFMRMVYYGAPAVEGGPPAMEPVLPVPEGWRMPSGLRTALVDKRTGKLASRWCAAEDQYLEFFVPGSEPTEFCGDSGGRRLGIPRQGP
jgi:penicillin-binding protein 1A